MSTHTMFRNSITPRLRQVFAVAAVALLVCGMRITKGFPAAALPQMDQPESRIHFTSQQSSWFATIPLLLSIPGSLVGGAMCQWGGPRRVILFLTPLACASTMAMTIASFEAVEASGYAEVLLLASRIMQGLIIAVQNTTTSIYIYEICDRHLRGTITSVKEIWGSVGYLLIYISGTFLEWYTIAWILPLVILLPAFLGIVMSPESPLWTARKGREEEAKTVLLLLRCTFEEAMEDLEGVHRSAGKDNQSFWEAMKAKLPKSNIMAIAASCLVLILKEFTGFFAISIYIVFIFDVAGMGIDSQINSVIIGFARIICNIFASLMLHRLRRKPVLIVGNALICVACAALGTYFFLQYTGRDYPWLWWLPVVSLVMHMMGYAGAVGPTSWTVALEILPGPVKSVGFGIAVAFSAAMSFLISKTFTDLKDVIGMHGVFWVFCAGGVSYIILIISYIPETYGLSVKHIEDSWKDSTK